MPAGISVCMSIGIFLNVSVFVSLSILVLLSRDICIYCSLFSFVTFRHTRVNLKREVQLYVNNLTTVIAQVDRAGFEAR